MPRKKKRTTETRSPSHPTNRDPREIGAEWDALLERWAHPMGDEYLRIALSSDEDFAAAKVGEGIARQQRQREEHAFEAFDVIRKGDHIVIVRRS
jgi:hypothetical protein